MPILTNLTPPPDEVREMIYYHNGNIYWFPEYRKGRRTDRPIGNVDTDGYRRTTITVDGVTRSYKVHRLIYWLNTGEWPEVVDHKDRKKDNNLFENLKASTTLENNQNKGMQKNNTTGYKGVSFSKGYWYIKIGYNGKVFTKWGFKSAESAALARDIIVMLFHDENALTNQEALSPV
ncbi:HNH endonuclease [Salmonella enterica subsp. enterica serovar Bredeney]